jgi:hypothetical protein
MEGIKKTLFVQNLKVKQKNQKLVRRKKESKLLYEILKRQIQKGNKECRGNI